MRRFTIFLVVGILLVGAASTLAGMYQNSTPLSLTWQDQPSQTVLILPTLTLTPYQPLTDTPTVTPSSTLTDTPTPSLTPTPSKTPTPSSTPTTSPTPTPLNKAMIEDIRGRWPAFSLDCEARSAVDWAAYFGVQIDEVNFFNALPLSDDPDLGFVGDVHAPWGQTPPNAYGVHAKPVARVLRSYGLQAKARTQMTFDELRAEISAGRPVIVWVVGRVGEGTPIAYTDADGNLTTVARFEHTVIVIGYTQSSVTVLDGDWVYTRQIQDFKNSWKVLGNMAVVWSGP